MFERLCCLAALLGLSLALSPTAGADIGPRAPTCDGCPEPIERPLPRSGFWFDPERPGSGFALDVQGGAVGGAYFGFEASGEPTWYTFGGQLVRSELPGSYWVLETDLLEFTGGSCIDCDHETNDPPRVEHRLRMTVLQRNLISFSLDDGPEERVHPLIYGSPMQPLLPEHLDLGLLGTVNAGPEHPALPYAWLFTLHTNSEDSPQIARPSPFGVSAHWSRGFRRSNTPSGLPVTADFFSATQGPNAVVWRSSLQCDSREGFSSSDLPSAVYESLGEGVLCIMGYSDGQTADASYFVASLGDLADDRIVLRSTDGAVLEAIRLFYR